MVGSLFTEPAADLIAACQVVIDEQTPLAQVSVAEALVDVVVVEPPPLEPQPAARNASDAARAIRLSVRVGFIVVSFSADREGRRVCRPSLPASYEVIAPDTSSWDFAIAFCSSS